MSRLKLRVGLLGLVAMLLVGSYAAVPASANPGPFCHHREVGSSKDDGKIKAQTPEQFEGPGGEQKLTGKLLGSAIEINSKQAQAKGVIFNNESQCQSKIDIVYVEPILVKPANSKCEVKVGENNKVKLFGHQAWTWDGTKGQLEEQPQKGQKPDWIFLPVELAEGVKELPNESFTEITLSKTGGGTCLLASKSKVNGSAAAVVEPKGLEEWGTTEKINSEKGEAKQHFWNGKEFVGVTTGLSFAGAAAGYNGAFTVKTIGRQQLPAQEIAHFEGP